VEYVRNPLLLPNTSPATPLGRLDTLLVSLNLALLHASKQARTSLPRPLEGSRRWLAQEVDLDQVRLKDALQRNDALDEQGVRVLEV